MQESEPMYLKDCIDCGRGRWVDLEGRCHRCTHTALAEKDARLLEVEAECEGLRKDKERLDWLSDQHNSRDIQRIDRNDGVRCQHTVKCRANQNVRAAIDDARSNTEQEEGGEGG